VEGDMKKDPEWQTNNNSHLPEIDGEIYVSYFILEHDHG
jgi:hypothetical protein